MTSSSYQECHFYFHVQVFFNEVVLEKAKYYALPIEFQERGSPHVHAFGF